MAAFIAKQLVGKQLDSVKDAVGAGGGDDAEKTEEGEDPEVAEARREVEEKRKEKHRKMEAEREDIRQEIRDKYKIKKKSEFDPLNQPGMEGRLGRQRKTPAELAAEANAEEEEESILPGNLAELASKPGELASKVTEKCILQ